NVLDDEHLHFFAMSIEVPSRYSQNLPPVSTERLIPDNVPLAGWLVLVMPPAIYLNVQFCIGKRCVCNVCSSGIWPSELWLYPVFLIVFKAHFIQKLV